MPPFSMENDGDRDALTIRLQESGYEVRQRQRNGKSAVEIRMYHYEDDSGPEGYIAGVTVTAQESYCDVVIVWLNPDGTEDASSLPALVKPVDTLESAYAATVEQCDAIQRQWA